MITQINKGKQRSAEIQQLVRSQFGYESLRPGQEEALSALLNGRDTLVVMPTGSGKSAIYQTAALLIPGVTVVISPLIALQQDQVESIDEQLTSEAAIVNSTISKSDRQEAFEDFQDDEAHCVSEWGHDFRPDYLRLGTVVEALGRPIVLGLTATAAPAVRDEIVDHLKMRNPKVIVQGFDRPNIWLKVKRFEDEGEKQRNLIKWAVKLKKPGIIHAAMRKKTEEIAQLLQERGVKALAYHAGMKAKEREQTQAVLMDDEAEVIVATTAFGMGIDKPNVRFVFHYHISDSLDSYYQEIGRAGRDGEKAIALLFYCPDDLKIRRFLASSGQIDVEEVEAVAVAVEEHNESIQRQELQETTGLSRSKLATVINRLEDVGAVEMLPTGEVSSTSQSLDAAAAAQEADRAQERYRQYLESRLEMMQGYAEVRDCRRQYILNYFGEDRKPCGSCDNCRAGRLVKDTDKPFPLNSTIEHPSWGKGQVLRYEGSKIVVLFDKVGYKTLGVKLAVQRNLLKLS